VELIRSSGRRADGDVAESDFLAWIDPHWETMRRVAWLTTITANEARKSWRPLRRADSIPDPGSAKASEVSVDLRRAVRALPKRQALAIELHYYVGLPIRETAQVMGCAEGTVKSTLAAARAALQLGATLHIASHADRPTLAVERRPHRRTEDARLAGRAPRSDREHP
jgi:hypothetical protein